MSKYSFELLLAFLQDNKYMDILRLINQYINIEATNTKPSNNAVETGLIGTDESLSKFNNQHIKLGHLPIDNMFYSDIERYLSTKVFKFN